jgi:hypothetical protein
MNTTLERRSDLDVERGNPVVLRSWRKALRLTMGDVARMLDTSVSAVSHLERDTCTTRRWEDARAQYQLLLRRCTEAVVEAFWKIESPYSRSMGYRLTRMIKSNWRETR